MRGLGGVSGRHARGGRLKHTCAQQRLAHGGQTQLQQRARRGTACVARAEDEQTAEEKPPPSKLATQLAALQRARFASDSAVAGDTNMAFRSPLSTLDIADNASVAAAPRHVDIRMYEGLAASRNRLSKKVMSLQRKAEALETQVAAKDDALVDAFDCLTRALCEYENLGKLSLAAAAGVQFGVDQTDALKKLLALQERIEFMHERVLEARRDLSGRVVHSTPVVWSGLASEVRLMGDFDNWGEGFLLSSDSIDDHVFKRFKAAVPLLPGRYRVKFSVDGEWRLASDWPTEDTPEGDTNNILVVDPQL